MSKLRTFISYSSKDSDFVLRLVEDMRAQGATPWLDQRDIPTGARWDESIEKGLNEADQILLVLSPTSAASQNVLDEVSYALDQGKRLIPVLLEPCDVPFRLRRFQYVDFTGNYDQALTRLLQTLDPDRADPELEVLPDTPPARKHGFRLKLAGLCLVLLVGIIALIQAVRPDAPPVQVPSGLVGSTLEQAQLAIQAAGLKVSDQHKTDFHPDKARGTVLDASPTPGSIVSDVSVPVVLTINKGILLPNLKGLSLANALEQLKQKGLKARISAPSHPSLSKQPLDPKISLVTKTTPGESQWVAMGSTVDISAVEFQSAWILGTWMNSEQEHEAWKLTEMRVRSTDDVNQIVFEMV